jgi:hypothetical protein
LDDRHTTGTSGRCDDSAGHDGLLLGRSPAKHCLPPMIDWITDHSRE